MLIPNSQFITPLPLVNVSFFFLSVSPLLLNRFLKKMTRKLPSSYLIHPKLIPQLHIDVREAEKYFLRLGSHEPRLHAVPYEFTLLKETKVSR